MASNLPKDLQILFKKIYKDGGEAVKTVRPGTKSMRLGYPCLFVYDAKWKHQLKYWDALPLSIVLVKYPDGFLGINLHYVPWTRRIQLANALVRRTKNKNRITYPMIKDAFKDARLPVGLAYLCLRRYLYTHVRSKMKQFDWVTYKEAVREIQPKFKKKSEKYIWAETLRMFNAQKRK